MNEKENSGYIGTTEYDAVAEIRKYIAPQHTMETNDKLPSYPLKWYYFLIYGYLIVSAVGAFLSGVIDLFGGEIVFGLLWLLLGVDALVTRSSLAKKKQHGPVALYDLMLWSYGLSCWETIEAWDRISDMGEILHYLSGDFMESLMAIVVGVVAIGGSIMILCNIVYFKKRQHMFNS